MTGLRFLTAGPQDRRTAFRRLAKPLGVKGETTRISMQYASGDAFQVVICLASVGEVLMVTQLES